MTGSIGNDLSKNAISVQSDGSSVIKVLPSSEMLLSLKKDPKKSFKLAMNDECESISSES